MTHSLPKEHRAFFRSAGVTALIALTMTGLAPVAAHASTWVSVTGTVLTSTSIPVANLAIYYDNVDCAADPDGEMLAYNNVLPDQFGTVFTDADGDFGFSGREGECYWIEARDISGIVDSKIGTRTAIAHIVGDSITGLPPGGVVLAMEVDGAYTVGVGGQWLKVEIPNAEKGTPVWLVANRGRDDWWLEAEGSVGIDLADVADPSIFSTVGGLPNLDETVLFETTPGSELALVYLGDQTYYPQLNGGYVIDPISLYPVDEADLGLASFTSPVDPVFQVANPFHRGASVTGRVILAGGGDPTTAKVQPWRLSTEEWAWGPENDGAFVAPNGTFTIGGITPGATITLAVNHPDYQRTWLGDVYRANVLVDKLFSTVSAGPSSGATAAGTITVSAKGGSLKGAFTGFPSGPNRESMILVRNVETGDYERDYVTGTSYSITGLTSGVFTIDGWTNDRRLFETTHGAEAIAEISEGKTVSADLKAEDRRGWTWEDSETTIRGRPRVGETLNVDRSDGAKQWTPRDPWESYETTWVKDHRIVGEGPARTLDDSDFGKTLHTATLATAKWIWPVWTTARTSQEVERAAGPRLTTVPSLSELTPRVGQAITVIDGVWTPAAKVLAYQWQVGPAGAETAIQGARSASYTPDARYVGQRLSVVVTVQAGQSETASVTVPAKNPVAKGSFDSQRLSLQTKLPKSSRVGKTLRAAAAPTGAKVSYQWYREGKAIKGATGAKYTLKAADLDKRVTVTLEASRFGYESAKYTSTTTKVVRGKLGAVKASLKGTAKVGNKLKAKAASKTKKVTLSYQWYVGGVKVAGPAGRKSSYAPTAIDRGKKVYAKVKVKKAGYKSVVEKTKTKTIG